MTREQWFVIYFIWWSGVFCGGAVTFLLTHV
jgi:hypothetical protein